MEKSSQLMVTVIADVQSNFNVRDLRASVFGAI